jgi:hypothetical protein
MNMTDSRGWTSFHYMARCVLCLLGW